MAKFENLMLTSARKSDGRKRVACISKNWSYSLYLGQWKKKRKIFTSRKGALHWVRNQRKKEVCA